ncbi:MAG: hypothetical protein ACRDK9_04480 [Solirubrobacterales bacterium]
MARPLTLLLALVAFGTPIGACGGGDDPPESTPEFDAAYAPINDQILELTADSVAGIGEPGAPVTGQTAAAAGELADRVEEIGREVSRLEPPEDLADATAALEETLADTAEGFDALAEAAEDGDQKAATAAIEQLGPAGQELNGAQDFLADVTGAPTGEEQ